MDFLERRSDDVAAGGGPASSGPGGDLGQISQDAQDLLAAADNEIKHALSTNTEAFLRATRQRGGQ